jgi:hypothetical protein
LTFKRADFAIPVAAKIKRHHEVERLVGVTRECERSETCQTDVDVEFFLQFADECFLRPFARAKFSAWKLPETCQRFASRTLRNQDAVIAIHEGGCDDEQELSF